jgi:hypothetical protein
MVRFSRKMENGGDTDMKVERNPQKLLLDTPGSEIDD